MHHIQYHAFLLTHHNVLFKSVLAFLLILLPFFFIEKKNQKNYKFITLSKRFHEFALVDQRYFFYWFCYIFEIAILYWKPMRNFLLKIIDLPASKNLGFSSFLYWDFQCHFSIDFAIFLKLPFYIKNQYHENLCIRWLGRVLSTCFFQNFRAS